MKNKNNLNLNSKFSAFKGMLLRYSMIVALLLTGASLYAQTTRTSVTTGNWGTASTWSPSGVPAAGDNVVIAAGHTVSLSVNTTVNGNLTVNGTLNRGIRNLIAGSLSGASTGVITSTGGSFTVGSNNTSTTYAGKISGSTITGQRILDKRGSGTLTLTGNSNYTAGDVNVSTGTLRLGVAGALPTTAIINVFNGGTFNLNGFNQTVKYMLEGSTTINPASPVAIVTNSSATAATLTLGTVGALEYSSYAGTMTGKLNIVVNDGMYLQGSGFGADVNVSVSNGAYLELGLIGPPSVSTVLSGNLSVATGGKVGLAQDATCNRLTLGTTLQSFGTYGSTASSATTTNNAVFDVTYSGVLTVNNPVPAGMKVSVKTGNWSDPATWNPAGVPVSSSNVVINAGHTVTQTADLTISGTLTVNGTLSRGARKLTAGSLSGGSTGVITVSGTGGWLRVGGNNTSTTYAGKFSGSTTGEVFQKRGTGTLTLTGNSNYTNGQVNVAQGTLLLGVAGALPTTAIIHVYNGGTFNLNGFNQTVRYMMDGYTTLNPASPVAIVTNSSATAATLTLGTVGALEYSSFAGTMTGKLDMVVNDGMYLDGSGFGADVNVSVSNGGELILGNTVSTVLSGNLSVATGGIVTLVQNATCNTLTLGATLQAAGTYGSTASSATTKNNAVFNVANTGVLTVTNPVVPPGGKVSAKTGNWSDAATWIPVGVPVSSSNVVINAGHTVTQTADLTISGTLTVNGTLIRGSRKLTAGSLSGASTGVITVSGIGGWLRVGGNNTSTTYAGKFSGATTGEVFQKRGTGTLTLTGNSDFTNGNVELLQGTLRMGVAGALPTTALINVYNGGTFDLNGFSQTVRVLSMGSTTINPASPVAIVTNSSATAATLTLGIVGAQEYSGFEGTMTGKLDMVVNDGMYLDGSGFGGDVNVSVSNGGELILGYTVSTVLSGNLSVATGGIVNLVQNATCKTLTLGATLQSAGSYGSTSSPATNQNNTIFTGTGVLNVLNSARLANASADQIEISDVRLFPNPSSDRSTLNFSSEVDGDYTLSVVDLSGRVVIQENRTSVVGLNNVEINLNGLSKGIYMVNLLNANNNNISKKLIVE